VRLHGVVGQRLVRVLDELLEVGVADPAREVVVVVRRQADHRDDLAGLRVHHDHDAALHADRLHRPLEGLLGLLLLGDVDRELQRIPGLGLADGPEDVATPARCALGDAFEAVDATEVGFVLRFDPGLAKPVIGQVAAVAELDELLRRHRPRVAEDLGHERTLRI
jgi:hypothetical protein